MSTNANDEQLKNQWRLKEWFPDISQKTLGQMLSFFELIVLHNKTMNLVSPKTVAVADALHFADCILGSQIVHEAAPGVGKIYDLGSGNGLPGIVFALLYPDVQVVLVDSDPRKVDFLKLVVSSLRIGNATAIQSTIETLPAQSVQFAITRGLGNISKTILMARKPVAKGGVLFHMKTEQWGLEITEIPTQLCSVWYPALVQEYILPSTQIRFGIVKTTKN